MNTLTNKKLELLCPAGDLSRLKTAVDFGADAVYIAGEEFGMRTASANFTRENLKQGVEYAHSHGVAVHVTCNTVPHNAEMERMPQYLEYLNSIGVDWSVMYSRCQIFFHFLLVRIVSASVLAFSALILYSNISTTIGKLFITPRILFFILVSHC